MKLRWTTFAATMVACGLAMAQPSPYFVWKNKTTGATICESEADESKWVKVSGPYEDPTCKFLIKS
jgi:hypothetical protein